MNSNSQTNPTPAGASRRDFIKSAAILAAGAMASGHGLAAVLDREKKFCGIVTIEDLVRRLVSSTEAKP